MIESTDPTSLESTSKNEAMESTSMADSAVSDFSCNAVVFGAGVIEGSFSCSGVPSFATSKALTGD